MLDRLRGARLLDETRGRAAVDRSAVGEVLVGLGRLAIEREDIVEIDLNPLIAGSWGAVAVDGLIVTSG